MKLLVVDDQSSVVNGIINGVEWKTEGFDKVFPAYNSAEAKRILEKYKIDVMLCDIEMPVENGLSLIRWIRENNMPTECILLSSHMEFEYAQQAVRLQILDYIIQPASIEKIRDVVGKAVKKIIARDVCNELEDDGRRYRKQKNIIQEGLLSRFLMYGEVWDKSKNASSIMPPIDGDGYLSLVQILKWDNQEPWSNSLVQVTLDNVASELFSDYGQKIWICQIETDLWAMVIYGNNYIMDLDGVIRQLEIFRCVCDEKLHFLIACYVMGSDKIAEFPKKMPELFKRKADNVAFESVIDCISYKDQVDEGIHLFPQYNRWYKMFCEGYAEAVRSEMLICLSDLNEQGNLNARTLHRFSVQFLYFINKVLEKNKETIDDIGLSSNEYEVYRKADHSLEYMKKFINITFQYLTKTYSNGITDSLNVEQIILYIQEHLSEELKREELAELFHLNPDHLTRIIKKFTGMTLKEYIITEKMKLAKNLLHTTSLPIGFIAAKVGYGNFSHFTRTYQKVIGILPSEEVRDKKI